MIDEVLIKRKIPYYLVGVNAMALKLLEKGGKPGRGTKDIDFALMVASMDEYEQIVELLVDQGFTRVKSPWTIYHSQFNVVVDLLPFGQIEENDTLSFHERYSDLHVLGFREVLESATEISIEYKIAKIPPLPGMIILKLVAWSDRPEERDNDLSDIFRIIETYYDHEWDHIVAVHYDLLDQVDEAHGDLKIAARVLGRQAQVYLRKSTELSKRIFDLLRNNLLDAESSQIAREWAKLKDIEVVEALLILQAFEKGLKELEAG